MKIIAQATACLIAAQAVGTATAWHTSSAPSAGRGQARTSFGVARKSLVGPLSYADPTHDDQQHDFSDLHRHSDNPKNVVSLPAPLLKDGELFHSDMITISALNLRRHSSMESIMDASDRISAELGIQLSKNNHRAHTSMTSYLYPGAAEDRVVAVNVLYDLLYFIDDIFGEDIETAPGAEQDQQEAMAAKDAPRLEELAKIWMTGEVDERVLSALPDGSNAKNICVALLWTRDELLRTCGDDPMLFRKISAILMEHLDEQLQPDANYADTDAYVQKRRKFSGMYLAVHLAEYCYGCHITEDVMEQLPTLQIAIDMCNDIGGLSNDVFSYPKESHSKLNLVNSFLVLGHANSLRQAVSMSVDHVNDCHDRYILAVQKAREDAANSKELTPEQKMRVAQFTTGMDSVLSASYHWQLMTQRYRHKDHILQDLRTDAPARSIDEVVTSGEAQLQHQEQENNIETVMEAVDMAASMAMNNNMVVGMSNSTFLGVGF